MESTELTFVFFVHEDDFSPTCIEIGFNVINEFFDFKSTGFGHPFSLAVPSSSEDLFAMFEGKGQFSPLFFETKDTSVSIYPTPLSSGFWGLDGSGPASLAAVFEEIGDRLVADLPVSFGLIMNSKTLGSSAPFDLKVRLPEIASLMYFGKPYIDLLGRGRLESTPHAEVRNVGPCIRVKPGFPMDQQVPRDVQDAIREHLGAEAFMKHPKWRYKNGLSPWTPTPKEQLKLPLRSRSAPEDRTITKAQELNLQLMELASFNEFDGAKVSADLRANVPIWRAAVMTRLVRPVYEKLENPFKRTTPPAPLLNQVNLITLRDLEQNVFNVDMLFIVAEPGRQADLENLAQSWRASDLGWHDASETAKAMGATRFEFDEYDSDRRVLLSLFWE